MKYFLFDIGHVLVDFDAADFLQEVARVSGRPVELLSEPDLEKINEVETGQLSDAGFVEYLNDSKGLSWTVSELIAIWSRMFSINKTGRRLFLDAVKTGIPVYTLSNIAQHHIDAIECNWNGFFDGAIGLFLSYQIGARKPDPSIYRYALDELGTQGEHCFFIDDRAENIDAAREAGMRAHQFIPENHATIQSAVTEFFGPPEKP
jgi:putative hydrolase of the HAD superfamily